MSLFQGHSHVANNEEELSKSKRERDLDSVRTMSDRQSLHEFLERKAELAVRGKLQLRKII